MDLAALPVSLNRDPFARDIIRELTGLLEEIIGLDEAEGFISLVGQRVGRTINAEYEAHLGDGEWTVGLIAEVLADLKRRIRGGFRVESIDGLSITLTNDACPFGDRVLDRPSLCMMTSNVFGTIAAQHRGFAQVIVETAIARGHDGCRVVVNLDPEAVLAGSRQYRRV